MGLHGRLGFILPFIYKSLNSSTNLLGRVGLFFMVTRFGWPYILDLLRYYNRDKSYYERKNWANP